MLLRKFSLILLLLTSLNAYGQQDVDFQLNMHLMPGKKVLKVKRDFYDPYVWVLAANNEVYRVNSQDQTIDDYTAKFSAYSNFQFIDIAGRSQDSVLIATNSTNIIRFSSGAIDMIGTANGLTDIVNSIGIQYFAFYPTFKAAILSIGTNGGIYNYNMNTGQMNAPVDKGMGRVYESNYRRLMYADSNKATINGRENNIVNFLPVFAGNNTNLYTSFLWEGGAQFGFNVHTAYFTPSIIYDDDNPIETDMYWGNDNGMWQISDAGSIYPSSPYTHFLSGTKVNKITGIYGLASFGNGHMYGDPGLIKENLLIGTNNGFYYSSSTYNIFGSGNLSPLSLFHDDDLGNVNVNDICVNATSTTEPICEDGVYVACDDGLYLLKPEYGKYINTPNLAAVRFQGLPATKLQINLCIGSSVTAAINDTVYTGHTMQWSKNGNPLTGQTQETLLITTSGDYYATLYDPCTNIKMQSNHLQVSVITAPVFTFNYPDKIQQCDNTPLSLQTTDNPGYTYRWYTNGALNGNTTSSYTVTQTGKYKVEVSACTNSWVPSKEIEVDMVTLPVPQVTADKPLYCAEDIAVLTEDVPVDPSYTINWYRDGTLLTADNNLTTINSTTPGNYTVVIASNISTCTQTSAALPLAFTPAPVFTFNYPSQVQYCAGTPLTLQVIGSANYQYRWYMDGTLNGVITASLPVTGNGKYKVEVSSCAGSWVASNEAQVNFVTVPVPAITTDKPAYCTSDNATLSLAQTVDPDYTIQWYKDNVPVPSSAGQNSIVTNVAGNYTVALAYNTPNTDGTTCSQTSAAQSITFNLPPTVTIQNIVNTTICDGQTLSLKANYNGGTVQWSTGETADQVSVTQPGTYTATVTSTAGCRAAASIDITFLPNPVFSMNDTSICTYKKQVVTLSAPSGFAQYAWNGQTGGQTYQVSQPQTVSLTVTDANGCQATQQIKVADQCPNIYIPNTFTPNSDGVNDTWVIEGLDNDPGSTVKVFTRYGNLIFESIGYGTPWAGEYKGKKLPPRCVLLCGYH